jgi:outer membrane lipoprotein SlyB
MKKFIVGIVLLSFCGCANQDISPGATVKTPDACKEQRERDPRAIC